MKLYTKEMFLKAAEECEVSMIDAKHIVEHLDEYTTPIELPSDYVIREASLIMHPPKMQNDYGKDYDDNIQYRDEWSDGAKWAINHIKQQDK